MQNKIDKKSIDKQTDELNHGLKKAYHKMLLLKKYKGTPVVVSENGKIKHLSADELLAKTQFIY